MSRAVPHRRGSGRGSARAVLAACLLALGLPTIAWAQQRDTVVAPETPLAVAREAASRYNLATTRADSAMSIEAGQVVEGDVGVIEAPLTISGIVHGSVVVVNGSLRLRPGARVEGDVLVVGGAIVGLDSAVVTGEARSYQSRIGYRREANGIAVDGEAPVAFTLGTWRRRLASDNGIRIGAFNPYNRVEGLPVYAGPVITRRGRWGELKAEAYGILRSAERFRWDSENLGHQVTLELRGGGGWRPLVGARLQDVVESVEPWQLSETEVGLATFFLHRDYQDWYSRLGGALYAGISGPRGTSLLATYSDERQGSRRDRDPWTLFRNSASWRANPTIDDGRFHTVKLDLHVDSRNDVSDPWAGWFVTAELERAHGRLTARGARSRSAPDVPFGLQPVAQPADDRIRFTRAFLDLRRYNRISPEAQLNARLVIGGWLGGDSLPLQRKLSVGGPGTLPGYDFRQLYAGTDVSQCSHPLAARGVPAECDRVALAQLEYRANLDLEALQRRLIPGQYGDAAIVLFVDAGRGWRVGSPDGTLTYRSGDFPPFNTFRTDVGAGLDFAVIGLYVAKAVSLSKEPANFVVRVRHRF